MHILEEIHSRLFTSHFAPFKGIGVHIQSWHGEEANSWPGGEHGTGETGPTAEVEKTGAEACLGAPDRDGGGHGGAA